MQAESKRFDDATGIWPPSDAPLHSMQAPFQSPQDAIAATNQFVANSLSSAQQQYQALAFPGRVALAYFADAAHALQDSTSPAHRSSGGGPYLWPGLPKVLLHGDEWLSKETLGDMTPAQRQDNIQMTRDVWEKITGKKCSCGR